MGVKGALVAKPVERETDDGPRVYWVEGGRLTCVGYVTVDGVGDRVWGDDEIADKDEGWVCNRDAMLVAEVEGVEVLIDDERIIHEAVGVDDGEAEHVAEDVCVSAKLGGYGETESESLGEDVGVNNRVTERVGDRPGAHDVTNGVCDGVGNRVREGVSDEVRHSGVGEREGVGVADGDVDGYQVAAGPTILVHAYRKLVSWVSTLHSSGMVPFSLGL